MPSRRIRHGYNSSMMYGKPYGNGHSTQGERPDCCYCQGGSACLPACCPGQLGGPEGPPNPW